MRHSGIGGLTALAVVAILVFAQAGGESDAHGTGIDVNSTDDRADVLPGDGICADGIGLCTLRAAVMEANAQLGPNEIHLPAGTYVLSLAGAGEDAAATGDLDFIDATTLIGAGAATTIIDGAGLDRVLHNTVLPGVTNPPEVAVSGVTLGNGGGDLSLGGAVYNAGRMRLTEVAVEESAADFFGGGIENDGSMTVERSTIGPGNGAEYGGGIFNFGELEITDTTIDGNDAGNQGGGMYNFGESSIAGSTFSGNDAVTDGGGVVNDGGVMEIVNSTISGNQAGMRGGGLANGGVTPGFRLPGPAVHGIPAHLDTLNVTIAHNSAAEGGNFVHVEGSTATLKNSLIANPSQGGDCSGAPFTSAGHNLDSDGTCGFGSAGDLSSVGPVIEPLAENGGATATHLIRGGSPAIDAGDDTPCPAVDQRSFTRPWDANGDGAARCDIGAVELHLISEPPPVPCPAAGQPCPPTPVIPTPTAFAPIELPRTGGEGAPPNPMPLAASAVALPALAGIVWLARRVFTQH
jgi:hypothetical protein